MAYPFAVATTKTYTVHAHVDYTPDAGIDQTLTVNPASYSMSVSPGSVLGGSSTQPVLTVNRTPPPLSQEPFSVTISSGSGTAPGTVEIQPSGSTQATISNSYAYATADVVTFCGTISGGSSCAANTTLTFTPLNVTLTLAPGSVVGKTGNGTIEGTGQGMISIGGPLSTQVTISFSGASPPISSTPSFGNIYIPAGSTSASFQFWGNYVTSVTSGTLTAYIGTANGNSSSSAGVTVYPAPGSAPMGPCKQCESGGGSPINFTDGNVWIQERDYSLPGLGGGLELTRTWNSLWSATQITSAGMFGRGWWSTYEERLWVGRNPVEYYRPDGTIWYFGQNPSNGSYYLYSPANEHATLSFSSLTSTYTLVFMDGSQRIFNSNGYLTTLIDRNGNQVSLTYDGSNRITQATDAASRAITFAYGDSSSPMQATSVQDATGTIGTYTYDSYSRLTKVQYADGSSLNFAYYGFAITSVTDGNGKVLESHTYDSSNRGLTSQRANGADAITVSYNTSTQTAITDSLGNSTTYTYEPLLGQYSMASIGGSGCASCGGRGNTSFTYDSGANLASRTDALGRTTNYTYDLYGDVLTKSIQLDSNTTLTWTYTYNGFGQVLTATDPLGNVTTNAYDSHGNLLSVTTPAPGGGGGSASVTQFAYNSLGELTQITDPLGDVTTMTYTPAGLIATIKDAQNNVTTYGYDARGNRTSVTDALSHQTTFAYDTMNRLTTITYPDSSTSSFTYDSRGRRITATDQNGKTTHYAYDDADRLTSVTDAASHATQYAYDTENNLLSVTDANSHATTFAYDAFDRVTKTTFPSTLAENYTYDLMGNLLTKTDRKNQEITYTYDALDRLIEKSYPAGSPVDYTYDAASRLTEVTDDSGTYGFTYDNMGRLTGTTTQYSFLTGTSFTNGYSYDADSNRTGFTAPDGSTNTYSYDTLNRLTALANSWAGSFGFSYDALSRRTQMTRPNGASTNYSYDNLSRLLSVLHQLSGSTIDGATYTLDNAGNRTAKTDQLAGVTTNYGYDSIHQLLSATQGATTTESYTYDPVGNRLSDLTTSGWSNNTSNELASRPGVSYTFDNNGNELTKLDSAGTTSYTWDYENRLTSVTLPGSGGTVSFKYDPMGRRIYKSSSSGTSIYAYDGDNVIEATNGTGALVSKYAQGQNIDEPLAQSSAGATNYYEADGLGSITSLSNSAGALAQTYTFDSFGKGTASTGSLTNPFQYTAREFDMETGLYYYRARYYDLSSGRFLSEDPSAFIGGLNFYRYVWNDPIRLIDPTGRIHQGADGKLHNDPAGGLEVLCGPGRDIPNDIQMLETSIAVRSAEIAALGKDADAGHIDRLAAEQAALAKCESCENERQLKEGPVDVPEWEQWFEKNRGKIYFVGAVGLGIAAVALAPETGGLSLALLATP